MKPVLFLLVAAAVQWEVRVSLENGESFVLWLAPTLHECRLDKARLDRQHAEINLAPLIEVACVPSASPAPHASE